ncbi:cation/H(+) antiporter 15-like isoform X1 [Nymphaea colorata]|nr:cation/H(+) antiporter 15-like isoform X1 [Nymphaea colorata]
MGSLTDTTCFGNKTIVSGGLWLGKNPLQFTFPLLCLQVLVVTLSHRALHFLFKPLKITKVSTDVLASLLLGPSALGRWAPSVTRALFPESSKVVLTMLGQLGLMYWFFLMGLQMNLGSQLKRIEKKSMAVAVASLFSPFLVAHLCVVTADSLVPEIMRINVTIFYVAVYLALPAISVLAHTVIEHKLLETPFGKLALSSAISMQLLLIPIFHVVLSFKPTPGQPWAPLWRLTYSIVFIAVVFALSRTVLVRIKNKVNEPFNSFILVAVAVAGGVTEAIGTHLTTGALIFGLFMPNGLLAAALVKKMEDVVALLVPLIFTMIGQQIDLAKMFTGPRGWTLVVVLLATFLGKCMVVALVATLFDYSFVDGFLAGVLLTTKGMIDAVLLGWTAGVKEHQLAEQSFVILIFSVIVTNLVVTLLIRLLYRRPASTESDMSCRTLQHMRWDTPFRVLACFHGHHMVTTLISLLKATQATSKSPIKLSALRLVHATAGCTTVVRDVNNTLNSSQDDHNNPITIAFSSQKSMQNILVEHFTRTSTYSTMDQDITKLAVDTDSAFIILPFQRHLSETAESNGNYFRSVVQKVLTNAPCSVGILVHRGLMRTSTHAFRRVAVLFFGGPDDREALAFAARMAKQEGTNISIVRFLPASHSSTNSHKMGAEWTAIHSMRTVSDDIDREKVVDDYCISQFQMQMAGKKSVSYTEKFVSCGAETVAFIQSMNHGREVFIVGRCQPTINSAMISGMEEWNEFPELGLMGDFLVSPDFSAVSVLVVQQHVWQKDVSDNVFVSLEGGKHPNVTGMWDSSKSNMTLRQTVGQRDPAWQWNLNVAF